MKKELILITVLLSLNGFCVLSDNDRENVEKTAVIIASHIDSAPNPQYWETLHSFGLDAIPVVYDLIYKVDPYKRRGMLFVFSCLRGNDEAIAEGLRKYIAKSSGSLNDDIDVDAFRTALKYLSEKGNSSDVDLLRKYETNTNVFIRGAASGAREKLEQRLEQVVRHKQSVVSQPINTPVLNRTGVVDKTSRTITTQEVVAPNVLPNQNKTSRKAFPYLVIVGGALLLVLGSIVVVTRKRKSGK